MSFRRLKPLSIVESAAATGDVLLSPAQLDAAWQDLNDEARQQGRGQDAFPLPPWSLRARYPLEFASFLQTGEMDFVISVYELEKLLHGRHNVRVRRIGVEVDGLLPAAGFVGTLTHRGVTLVRDRDATLAPGTTRLTPTEAELRAALGELEGGSSERVVAQGLVPFVLIDEDGSLSISSEREVTLPDDDVPFDLLPIENYGLTGAWRLTVPDTDLRNVTDVRLMFIVSVPAASEDAGRPGGRADRRVRGRAARPTASSTRSLAVSVRQRFPDAFADLATGPATVVLTEDDFPGAGPRVAGHRRRGPGGRRRRRRAGRHRAGDRRRPGTRRLVRTTGAGGFTEDLPPSCRDPGAGPAAAGRHAGGCGSPTRRRFAELGDLTLFVVHTLQ